MRYFLVCAAILVAAGCGARQEPVQQPVTPEVSVRNDPLVEQARKEGKAGVGLIVSTVEGKTEETAQALQALGAHVESSDPKVGYLRVTLPTQAFAQAKAIPSITAIDVEGLVDRIEPPS
jgi:hypothetical protein